MSYETIIYEVQDNVLTVALNRPDSYNAFNETMKKELIDAFKSAARDPEVRAIILTGAGKAFSSGQDLKEARASAGMSFGTLLEKSYNRIIRRMRTIEKPIIGSINGVAAGAGCSVALACDVRVASEYASFTEAFIRVGLVPDSGSSFFLPRLVGMAKAFELAAFGDIVKADDALQMGLVNTVVPADELEKTTQEWALRLAKGPSKAIGMTKRMLNKALTSDLETILSYEAHMQDVAGRTEDYKEGVAAFIEKREPNFQGK